MPNTRLEWMNKCIKAHGQSTSVDGKLFTGNKFPITESKFPFMENYFYMKISWISLNVIHFQLIENDTTKNELPYTENQPDCPENHPTSTSVPSFDSFFITSKYHYASYIHIAKCQVFGNFVIVFNHFHPLVQIYVRFKCHMKVR